MLSSLLGQFFFSVSIAVLSRKSSDVRSLNRSVGSWISASKCPTVLWWKKQVLFTNVFHASQARGVGNEYTLQRLSS